MGESFTRTWRGYRPADVDAAIARSTLRIEQLEHELEAAAAGTTAMQVEIRDLHARVDAAREREQSLLRSLTDLRERREEWEREAAARARHVLLDAEERAAALKSEGIRQVGELQRQVEQLLGMRTGLTLAMQRLSEDIAAAMARLAASPATAIDRTVEDQVDRWAEQRAEY
ncbi:MAG TPA: DivIVA domain-containing protein [Gaiellaceae bacterium]|nr:DivIVA domain-containing protein [Gaiellaceae bacterium]